MHVVIVNRHESMLLRMIELSAQHLTPEQLRILYHTQTDGAFFDDAPMRNYGGTVLAWVCVFGMKKALVALLETTALVPFIDLNDKKQVTHHRQSNRCNRCNRSSLSSTSTRRSSSAITSKAPRTTPPKPRGR